MRVLGSIVLIGAAALAPAQGWQSVESALGRKGVERDGVYRVTFPRRDLDVRIGDARIGDTRIGGIRIEPAFGLTTWAAFSRMTGHRSRFVMVMGDFVVTDAELPAAQKALLDGGLTVTAVHNHLAGESPSIKYMHFSGRGEPGKLAQALRTALAATGTPSGTPAPAAPVPEPDWTAVESALGVKGTRNGKVLNVGVPRLEKILEEGEELKATNGGASSINFQWIADGRVAVTSDLVLLRNEVQPVIRALYQNGITITALHNHMIEDEPRTFHLHVWAVGDPAKLAQGMAAALALTNSKRG
jgi:hypothetical protein